MDTHQSKTISLIEQKAYCGNLNIFFSTLLESHGVSRKSYFDLDETALQDMAMPYFEKDFAIEGPADYQAFKTRPLIERCKRFQAHHYLNVRLYRLFGKERFKEYIGFSLLEKYNLFPSYKAPEIKEERRPKAQQWVKKKKAKNNKWKRHQKHWVYPASGVGHKQTGRRSSGPNWWSFMN